MSDDFAPSQPGGLQDAYRSSLNQLIASDSLRRLWAKDPSLWPGDERARSTLAASLAWLDVPHYLPQYLASFAAIVMPPTATASETSSLSPQTSRTC
jgi:hypothetical protein